MLQHEWGACQLRCEGTGPRLVHDIEDRSFFGWSAYSAVGMDYATVDGSRRARGRPWPASEGICAQMRMCLQLNVVLNFNLPLYCANAWFTALAGFVSPCLVFGFEYESLSM